jgi:hypothetical protein
MVGGERGIIPPVALERLAQKVSVFPQVPACSPIRRLAVLASVRTPVGGKGGNTDLWLRSGNLKRHIACPALQCLLSVWDTLASASMPAVPRCRSVARFPGNNPSIILHANRGNLILALKIPLRSARSPLPEGKKRAPLAQPLIRRAWLTGLDRRCPHFIAGGLVGRRRCLNHITSFGP